MLAIDDLGVRILAPLGLTASLVACSSGEKKVSADTALLVADAADYEGCPDLPGFVVGSSARGKDDRIDATLLDASPSPPRRYRNVWTLKVTDARDHLLNDAEVTAIRTYMPLHGHAGTPAANAEMTAVAGEIRADLNFTMRGYWEVQINVSSASAGDDYIMFPVCIAQ